MWHRSHKFKSNQPIFLYDMLENWIKKLGKGGKLSLLYNEKSHIFDLSQNDPLCVIRGKIAERCKISAVLPTLEEGLLHKNKQILNYLT